MSWLETCEWRQVRNMFFVLATFENHEVSLENDSGVECLRCAVSREWLAVAGPTT